MLGCNEKQSLVHQRLKGLTRNGGKRRRNAISEKSFTSSDFRGPLMISRSALPSSLTEPRRDVPPPRNAAYALRSSSKLFAKYSSVVENQTADSHISSAGSQTCCTSGQWTTPPHTKMTLNALLPFRKAAGIGHCGTFWANTSSVLNPTQKANTQTFLERGKRVKQKSFFYRRNTGCALRHHAFQTQFQIHH